MESEKKIYTMEEVTDLLNFHNQHIQTLYLIMEKMQEFIVKQDEDGK